MHKTHRSALERFSQWCSLAALSLALAVPMAHAAPKKPAKKQQVSSAPAKRTVARKATAPRKVARSAKAPVRAAYVAPERQSFGQLAGLHQVSDPLSLKSSVALVVDQDTHEVLLSKNDKAVLPIASLTKLMTGLLISEAHLPMDEPLTITQDDVDTEKGSRSRLSVGTTLMPSPATTEL